MVSALRNACDKGVRRELERRDALTLVLRDMGNQVTRIESAELVPGNPFRPDECVPLVFPLSARLADLVGVALDHLNAEMDVREGCLRCVCEGITEIIVW